MPIAVALLVTVLLAPLVGWLVRRGLPRVAAVGIALAGLVVLVGGLLTLAGRSIVKGFGELWDQAAQGIDKLTTWLAEGPLAADDRRHLRVDGAASRGRSAAAAPSWSPARCTPPRRSRTSPRARSSRCSARSSSCSTGAPSGRGSSACCRAGPASTCTRPVGAGWSRSARTPARRSSSRGVDAVGIGLGAAILRCPLALPLAVLVFLGSFIPIVGRGRHRARSRSSSRSCPTGRPTALWMLVVVLLVQQIEGHVLQPFLMGHAVSLHPVAVSCCRSRRARSSRASSVRCSRCRSPRSSTPCCSTCTGTTSSRSSGTDDHVPVRGRGHPVLDRAIAQVAEATSERVATEAETAERLDADEPPATVDTVAEDAGEPGGPDDASADEPAMTGLADVRAAAELLEGVADRTPVQLSRALSQACGRRGAGSSARTCSAPGRSRCAAPTCAWRGSRPRSRRGASSRRAPATTRRGSRSRPGCSAWTPSCSCPSTPRCRRSPRPATTAPRCGWSGASVDEALVARAASSRTRTGAVLIHPFDHADVVAGQGTIALEIVEQVPDVATVVVPLGGGGLAAGVVAALRRAAARRARGRRAGGAARPPTRRRSRPATRSPRPAARRWPTASRSALPGAVPFGILAGRRHRGADRHRGGPVPGAAAGRGAGQAAGRAVRGGRRSAALMAGPGALEGPVVVVLSGGNIDPLVLCGWSGTGSRRPGGSCSCGSGSTTRPGALADLLRAPRGHRRERHARLARAHRRRPRARRGRDRGPGRDQGPRALRPRAWSSCGPRATG